MQQAQGQAVQVCFDCLASKMQAIRFSETSATKY